MVAIPSQEFGGQELKTAIEIKTFISQYGLPSDNFTMLEESRMNGPKTHPIVLLCKSKFPGKTKWNFGDKFIFNKSGELVARTKGIKDTLEAFQPLLGDTTHFDMLYSQFRETAPGKSSAKAPIAPPVAANSTDAMVVSDSALGLASPTKKAKMEAATAAAAAAAAANPNPNVSISIQWWGGYNKSRQAAEALIKDWFPSVAIDSRQDSGKTGNFEIKVNDVLVHSKKTAGHGFLHECTNQQAVVRAEIEKALQAAA